MARLPAAPGRVRAAAGPAGRGIEAADAGIAGRPRRWRAPCRACRGSGRRCARAGSRPPTASPVSAETWLGTPTPIVSPKQTSSTPRSSSRRATLTAAAGCDAAGVRAAERGRDVAAPPPAELAGPRQHRREGGQRFLDRHPDVGLGERVGRRGEDGERIGAGGLGPGHAALVRDEDRVADAGRGDRGRPSGRRRRRAAGSPLGDTNEVASISRRPASASSSMKRALVAVGIDAGLVLEPVARPDLVDPDGLGHRMVDGGQAGRVRRAAGPSPARCGRPRLRSD